MKTDVKKDQDKFNRLVNRSYWSCLIILMLLTVASVLHFSFNDLNGLRMEYVRDVTMDIMGLCICVVLAFSTARDKPWDKQNRSLFRLIFVLGIMIYLDFVSSIFEGNTNHITLIKLVNTIEYLNEVVIVYCYWAYIREELKLKGDNFIKFNRYCRMAVLLEMIATVINWFFGFFFYITPEAEFEFGKFNWCSELVTFSIFIVIFVIIVRNNKINIHEKVTLLTFQIFPFFVTLYSLISDEYNFLDPAYLLSVLLIYINVFSERSKKVLEQEALLTKQSTQLMISQIQPHFLYNVLTTISNLCVTDPEEAEETTVLFSQYLRTNLDSLRQTETVPFNKEIEHIRTYVELEKKRFGDKLNVTYEIEEEGFEVPSLGLQPIVENSVKHGIRGKDSPGHLKISSRKTERGYEVIIEDDGVGFDPNGPMPDDGRSHVGMINVRKRLEQMCDANMEVISSPGNGCKTTVIFPIEIN